MEAPRKGRLPPYGGPSFWLPDRQKKKQKAKEIRCFRIGSMQLKTKTHDRKSSVQGDSTHRFFFFSEQNTPKKSAFCKTKREKIRKKTDGNRFFWKRFFFFFSLKSVSFFLEACPLFLFSIQGSVTNGREKDPLFFSKVVCFPTKSRSFCMPQY